MDNVSIGCRICSQWPIWQQLHLHAPSQIQYSHMILRHNDYFVLRNTGYLCPVTLRLEQAKKCLAFTEVALHGLPVVV